MLGFFTGKTHADNVIAIALHGSHKLIVDSVGGREQGRIHSDRRCAGGRETGAQTDLGHACRGPNHFTGSLTDAAGPVDVVVAGNTATIRYVMKDGNCRLNSG